jgi:uncharacterized repeat protein (TIGR01451 family)
MKQKMLICLVAFTAFLSFSALQAQGWDKTFTSPLGDTTVAFSAVETADSGFAFIGGTVTNNGLCPLVVRTNKQGDVIWRYNPSDLFILDTMKIFRTRDNSLILLASKEPEYSILLIKLNSSGIEQSRKEYLRGNNLKDADITAELDRIVVVTEQRTTFLTGSNLLQLSADGDSISNRFFRYENLEKVAFGGDRQIYAVRGRSFINTESGIMKYNLSGDSVWMSSKYYGIEKLKRANDGRILMNSHIKIDYDGRFIFNGNPHPINLVDSKFISDVFTQRKEDNNIYSVTNYTGIASIFDGLNYFFTKRDSIGRQILSQQLITNVRHTQGFGGSLISDMISTSEGGFLLVGRTNNYTGQARLIKVNEKGRAYSNDLKGNIYFDSSRNCRMDTSEISFSNRLVSVEKGNEIRWAKTNTSGNYEMQIDTGNYLIRSTLPNQNWRFCTPSVSKQISATNPIDTVNFALQALVNCPQMRISTAIQGLRRCFDNNVYHIRYTNEGTQAAQNAFITLKLDSLLEYVSASRPLSSRTGQTLRFNLGTVLIGFDDQFSVQVRIKCGDSTRLGQTLCTEARIFPDTVCIPAPNWSGANIVVSGRCDRDSVRFLVQNIGTGASSNLRRQIVEDEIVFLNGTINVPASTSRTFSVPANGKTWRLNVDQEPNNPLSNQPTAVVEGCRTSPNQPISTGFVNQFPTDDGSPTIDNVCTPIVGAYDPNDKEGLPLGYKNQRFINQNQAIDYRIRFQNTGNDTAFTVVLRDTLSDFLDISSLKVGASSHKYTWTIEGKNVLVFRFDNIKLVDSFRNVAASQGFVAFKINQKKDVALGSVINNQADIYFDFNAPIFTNKTLHTVGKDFIVSVLQISSTSPNVRINVFPNPFSAQATIEIQGFDKKGPLSILSDFTLFDALGRQLRREKFDGNQFVFERQNLGTGVYFFKIENGGKLIGTGKFLIQ